MNPSLRPARDRLARVAVAVGVAVTAGGVYWRTAHPTITWWDSSSYSLASATLGITSSPGSLVLTLLGWAVTRATSGLTTARGLALSGAAIAVLTVLLVHLAAGRILSLHRNDRAVGLVAAVGTALGALVFAFGTTPWEYATQFTPYILSAAFTALIVTVMLWWWRGADQAGSWRALAVLALLFGLDFSVHRTNALLAPGVLAWILVRRPRTFLRPASWVAAIGGLITGLSVQLLVMPIASVSRSPIIMYEPTTWTRFWDYVSLAQVGGGFLVDIWPRKASVWSVQVMDLLRVLRDVYFHVDGPLGPAGLVPGIAVIVALVALWRRSRALAVAFVLVIILHAATTVLYFNIPENYFRSLYRHYLPVIVVVGTVASAGMGVLATAAFALIRQQRRSLALGAAGIVTIVLVLVPVDQLARNWRASDASRRYFARDYAVSALTALPPNTIYFTVGDNDTFPLWYVQAVEGVRRDVVVMNLSLANADWYVDQLAHRYPAFPIRSFASVPRDSVPVDVPVVGTADRFGLAKDSPVPNAVTIDPVPRYGSAMLPADWVLIHLVRNNAWRLPLAVSMTAGHDGLGWLARYARAEGLFWRITPVADAAPDPVQLRTALLHDVELRGYADPTVRVDDTSRSIGGVYIEALRQLLAADVAAGNAEQCRADLEAGFARVPPARLGYTREDIDAIGRTCVGSSQ